jgi:hypothetical protein
MRTISPRIRKQFRIPAATCGVLILLILVSSPLYSQKRRAPYSKDTLLTALRKNAQTKDLTSNDFVSYIEQRGVDFQLLTTDEAQLREAGASTEIIAAIRSNYRPVDSAPTGASELTVRTSPPQSEVLINGQVRGITNADGFLTLYSVKPGRYLVSARKAKYKQTEVSVQVQSGESQAVEITLSGDPGKLNVTSTISGATIEIANNGSYPDQVSGLELAPGTYEIVVSKSGYQPVRRQAAIKPGETLDLSVTLDPVPAEELLQNVEASFQSKQYARTVALGESLLSVHPDNRRANFLVGLSYYQTSQFAKGIPALRQAIILGEEVRFPIKHRHGGPGLGLDEDMCVGEIVLRKDSVEFHSTSTNSESGQLRFSTHGFNVPFKQVYELKLNPRKLGRLEIKIGVPDGSKEKRKEFDLYSNGASLQDTGVSGHFWTIVCSACGRDAQFILELMQQVMTSSSVVPQTENIAPPVITSDMHASATLSSSTSPIPSVEEISSAYIQATGGKAAIEKLTTRSMKGQYIASLPQGTVTGTIEVYAKAPNKEMLRLTIPGKLTIQEGFDGAIGWTKDANKRAAQLSGPTLALKRASAQTNFLVDVDQFKAQFSSLTVKGRARIGDQEAYVVEATLPDDKPWTFYFSTATNLMIRFDHVEAGGPVQHFLEDYREVDGVRLAFTNRIIQQGFTHTIKFYEIKHNVPVDDAIFVMPAK